MALSKTELPDASYWSQIFVMNNEDRQLTSEMCSLQPLGLVFKKNGYYDVVTLLQDKIKHLAFSICICTFDLDNKQWLDRVIELVRLRRHQLHHDIKQWGALGITLLLSSDIQKKDLPAELQLLTCLRICCNLNEKNRAALRGMLQQMHARRMELLRNNGFPSKLSSSASIG